MKTYFLKLFATGILAFVVVFMSTTPSFAQAASIVGSWDMVINFHDCGSTTTTATAPGLISYMTGGVLQEYGTGQPIPRNRTNAFGNWERVEGRSFSAVAKAFRFAPDGTLAGTAKLYRSIELSDDGQSFIAEARAEVYDLNGVLLPIPPGRGCATEVGTRIE